MYEYVYINTAYRQNIDTQVQKVSCYGMQPDMGSGKVIQNMEWMSYIGIKFGIRGYIQKFPDWPPGARTSDGTTVSH
jgi:hypothetical protein